MRWSSLSLSILTSLASLASLASLGGCTDDADGPGPAATTCATHFDCSAAKPYCRVTSNVGTCLAPLDECTGDDPNETDDGPAAARTLSVGAPIDAKSCTGTGLERDWYRFTQSAEGAPTVMVMWTDTNAHFNAKLYDASGTKIDPGQGSGGDDLSGTDAYRSLPAGTYFIEVDPNTLGGDSTGKTAVAYQIMLDVQPAP